MTEAEDKAAAQGAFVVAAVALQELREKDEAIEHLEARVVDLLGQVTDLEREADEMVARIEELSSGVAKEAA